MKILIVDDTEKNLMALQATLAEEGFNVILASNGREAMQAINKHKIDFIISDLNMPIIDGYELALTVKKGHEIPFLLYTSMNVSDDLLSLCSKMGIDNLIPNSTIKKIKDAVMARFQNAFKENQRLRQIIN